MKKGQFPTAPIPPAFSGLVVWFEDERFGWSYPLWLARYGEGPTCGADCPLVAAARAMGEAGRTARPACRSNA
jgi:hypothetical protein